MVHVTATVTKRGRDTCRRT